MLNQTALTTIARKRFLFLIAGWAASRFVLGWVPVSFSVGLFLHPAVLAPVFFLAVSAVALLGRKGPGWVFWVSTGWVADILVFLAVRPGTGTISLDYWASPVLAGSVSALLVTASVGLILAFFPREDTGLPALYPPYLALVFLCMALAFAAARLLNLLGGSMPNEARSLFLGGIEVHHLNFGLLFVFSSCAWGATRFRCRWAQPLAAITLGVGSGLVLDESVYYALEHVSDDAYLEAASLVGGVVVSLVFCVGSAGYVKAVYGSPVNIPRRPRGVPSGARLLIGHRGAAGLEDENTIEAVRAGLATGVEMIEVDIGVSSNGEFFLMHDERVDRTTDGSGFLNRMTAETIRSLRTKRGHRVPTLMELLTCPEIKGKTLFLDMKYLRGRREALTAILGAAGVEDDVILDYQILDEAAGIKREYPDLPVVISPMLPFFLSEAVVACRVDGIDIYYHALTERILRRISVHGFLRTCWYTSDPKKATRILRKDIDGLMSNRPDLLIHIKPGAGEAST